MGEVSRIRTFLLPDVSIEPIHPVATWLDGTGGVPLDFSRVFFYTSATIADSLHARTDSRAIDVDSDMILTLP